MLEIFNTLSPFIEDNYREISVREYSREKGISPPTSSKVLKQLEKEGLLKKREDRKNHLFKANTENQVLKQLARTYWAIKLQKITEKLKESSLNPTIILFGSLSKLETKEESDIDLAVISKMYKSINTAKAEIELKRKIQIFQFSSVSKISKNLRKNIINGHILSGEI